MLLVKMNLLAAGPYMNTVGLPNRFSFDMGPYLLTLSWIHCSAVFARIARRRSKLWPIMGIPIEPGGTVVVDEEYVVFLVLLRKIRIGMRKTRAAKRILSIVIMLGLLVWNLRRMMVLALLLKEENCPYFEIHHNLLFSFCFFPKKKKKN